MLTVCGDAQGDDSQRGTWLRTGPILELMDVLAGAISARYARYCSR